VLELALRNGQAGINKPAEQVGGKPSKPWAHPSVNHFSAASCTFFISFMGALQSPEFFR
jgi:hypothetical protein